MTDQQLYIAIGVPILFNGICFLLLNSRISDVKDLLGKRIDDLRTDSDRQFKEIKEKFDKVKIIN